MYTQEINEPRVEEGEIQQRSAVPQSTEIATIARRSSGSQNAAIAPGPGLAAEQMSTEDTHLFAERSQNQNSLTPEQAFVHMVKAMLGTGLLSLPYAFKHSGLYLGLFLLILICFVCMYCMRQIVFAAHYVCSRTGREMIDYANIMRGAVEAGPSWISGRGYFFKQLVNVQMFMAQLGFCCVYFVFMADNLEDFFKTNSDLYLSKSIWMLLLLVPILAICSIRRLRILAPFAIAANILYLVAVAIVAYYFFTHLQSADSLTKYGRLQDLPLFFGTVMFAFEGVCVVMPIENRMQKPQLFIAWNGVLNSSCLTVLAIFAVTGFYGYLAFGDKVYDTVTINLPHEPFYDTLKLMFVTCVIVSYPIQFFVPMERIEKFITRKCAQEKRIRNIYFARFAMVLFTCAVAELVPYLALFISLVGAIACTSLALLFPPMIDLLVSYSQGTLSPVVYLRNLVIFGFAFVGFSTGTYSALLGIFQKFQ